MFWTVERQRMISTIGYLFRLKSLLLTSSDTSASLNFRPAVVFSAVFSSAARRRASCDPGPSRIQHFYFDASGRFFKRAAITCSMQHEHPHWQCLGCLWGAFPDHRLPAVVDAQRPHPSASDPKFAIKGNSQVWSGLRKCFAHHHSVSRNGHHHTGQTCWVTCSS